MPTEAIGNTSLRILLGENMCELNTCEYRGGSRRKEEGKGRSRNFACQDLPTFPPIQPTNLTT